MSLKTLTSVFAPVEVKNMQELSELKLVRYLLGLSTKTWCPGDQVCLKHHHPTEDILLIWTIWHYLTINNFLTTWKFVFSFQGFRQPTWPETHVLNKQTTNKQTNTWTWNQMHLVNTYTCKRAEVRPTWNIMCSFWGVGGYFFFCLEPGRLWTTLTNILVGLRWSLPSQYSSESFGNVLCARLPHAANSHSEGSRNV